MSPATLGNGPPPIKVLPREYSDRRIVGSGYSDTFTWKMTMQIRNSCNAADLSEFPAISENPETAPTMTSDSNGTPIILAASWTSLPSEFRRPGLSKHSLNQKRGKPLDSFLEGPIWVSDLDLLFVTDIPYGRIFSIDDNAQWSLVIEYDGEPNGLAWNHLTRKIVIADFKQGILELDPITKELRTLAARYHGERFKGPNDLVVRSDGSIFFTDQGMTGLHDPTGRVFRMDPDGRLELILSNGPSPNGLVLSHDESALFVAMTRDNAVWHVPFMRDGSVQRVGRFSSYYGIGGPDGMTQDSEGNILVAHSSLGTVFGHRGNGEMMKKIKSPEGVSTTNLTWGGPDLKTLYLVESGTGSILKIDWHCSGWLM
ncbi:calcium-dependent phosphotriesterase [Aspergillus ellipticus CBS 707.79]|uniref:Calcium-dependent phosphotriesterase n=1 Tax=Aspergillus ellipticus CBS 707.79 TaxID=1448320 RepID=A0A319DE76_9EURO|nr:calcium-dependent phosphotriesterase [Aspergillus ellipticus CBS 707.79]